MRARGRCHGFTFFEMTFAVGALATILLAAGQVFGSSERLGQDSRALRLAHEELRANLEGVANVVRGVDLDTLIGFDAEGRAVAPTFRRVQGANALGRVYGPVETLVWRPLAVGVDGVPHPGVVVHRIGSAERIVAKNVPRDGFWLAWDGSALAVCLQTYARTSAGHTVMVAGSTAVHVRN